MIMCAMDTIIILDFGGQYCHLIARRIRDFGVYSEILSSDISIEKLSSPDIRGIILSGGAASVYDEQSPKCDRKLLDLGIPLLGICYGHQLLAHMEKGEVIAGNSGEYGITSLNIARQSKLLDGLNKTEKVWMNHRDIVNKLPAGYLATASTESSPIASFENMEKKIYGVQFHPEVTHTENGAKILENFIFKICNVKK